VFCIAQSKNLTHPHVLQCHTYLLTTRRVPEYPVSYPVGYPGNELPDNGSPSDRQGTNCLWTS